MKEKIRNVFATRWPIYLVWLIISIILWSWIVHAINDPSAEEVFWVFVSGYSYESETIKSNIQNSQNFPSSIRRFYVKGASLSNQNYDTYLNTYGLVHSDLLIMPKNKLDALGDYDSLCASFNSEFKNSVFNEIPNETLEQNGNLYGFKVYDKNTKVGVYDDLIKYEDSEIESQDYYLVFKTTSVHLGKMEENTKTDYAITIAKEILLNG